MWRTWGLFRGKIIRRAFSIALALFWNFALRAHRDCAFGLKAPQKRVRFWRELWLSRDWREDGHGAGGIKSNCLDNIHSRHIECGKRRLSTLHRLSTVHSPWVTLLLPASLIPPSLNNGASPRLVAQGFIVGCPLSHLFPIPYAPLISVETAGYQFTVPCVLNASIVGKMA